MSCAHEQVAMDENSRKYLAIDTHKGLHSYINPQLMILQSTTNKICQAFWELQSRWFYHHIKCQRYCKRCTLDEILNHPHHHSVKLQQFLWTKQKWCITIWRQVPKSWTLVISSRRPKHAEKKSILYGNYSQLF